MHVLAIFPDLKKVFSVALNLCTFAKLTLPKVVLFVVLLRKSIFLLTKK